MIIIETRCISHIIRDERGEVEHLDALAMVRILEWLRERAGCFRAGRVGNWRDVGIDKTVWSYSFNHSK